RSSIVELDLTAGKVGAELPLMKPDSPIAPGSHPAAMALSPDDTMLYVALANRDAVAEVNISSGMQQQRILSTTLPGQTLFGGVPNALALSADGKRLYVANAG